MKEHELLARIARTLKLDIGPAVGEDYAKTQTYMAAVVLQKLAGQLEHAGTHRAADAADFDVLIADLEAQAAPGTLPAAVADALTACRGRAEPGQLCRLIEALYASKAALGDDLFEDLLSRIRRTLRRNIDRRMEYAA